MAEPEGVERGERADDGGELAKLVLVEEEFMEMREMGEGGREGREEVVTGPQSLQVD